MNVQFFVQARLGSSRFPGKVLETVRPGVTMLECIDRRIRRARCHVDGAIVYLTTTSATDDRLVEFLEARQWSYLRGDEADVFSRFRLACEERRPDLFFRVCADNPLLEPAFLDRLADANDRSRADYTSFADPMGKPVVLTHYGFFAELIDAEAFLAIDEESVGPDTREHVTPIFYKNRERFDVRLLPIPEEMIDDRVRLTVDAPRDLEIIRELVGLLGMDASVQDIYRCLGETPELLDKMAANIRRN
jgi:spore coat polysaccharide biosynthesis protein SpsF